MIDKPLYQNPLAGGALLGPQENQLQGDALVEQLQMRMQQRDQKTPAFMAYFGDVMDTKGYPTKTMQDYESQFPNPLTERIFTQEDGINFLNSNMPLGMFNATPPSLHVSEQNQSPLKGVSQDIFGNPNILRDSDGNPLPSLTPLSYDELQGDALVKQITMRMMQQDIKSPAFNAFASEVMKTKGYPTKTLQEYNTLFPNNLLTQNPLGFDQLNVDAGLLGAKIPNQKEGMPEAFDPNTPLDPQADIPDVLGPQLIDPGAEARRKADEEFLKTADEYQRGFRESEFYKPGGAVTADMAEFIYSSPTRGDITMKGSSSQIGQFGSYLDSIGKGDLLQRVGGSFSQDLLGTVNPNDPYDLGSAKPVVNPIVSGPETFEIATQQVLNPFQEQFTGFQNQLTGFGDQFSGLNDRLNKIEEGIASLLGNRGQGFNMGFQPNYGFNYSGIGSFFPPFGGMYG